MLPAVLDRAKVIIWDLDGTFWDGVLTEEGARFRPDRLEVAVELNQRGIVSSIASNNDLAAAQAFLESNDAWAHFVFPAIAWRAKTDLVRAILADTQLRPQNAIFLDDTPWVRELVAAELPELLAVGTADEFVAAYREWGAGKPFDDPVLERLGHYKLLERRGVARRTYPATPEATIAFLRRSKILCTVTPVSKRLSGRVHELVLRTNQLNFTKKRVTADELRALLESDRHQCRAIHVEDRFGDYGTCGFYALELGERPKLVHFLFSCRILHMGIEAALYARLGAPAIEGPDGEAAVSAALEREASVTDWVAVEDRARRRAAARPAKAPVPARTRLLMVGPCELESVGGAIRALCSDEIDTRLQVNFVNDGGRVIRHHGHHAFLELARDPRLGTRHAATLAALPWFDPKLLDLSFDRVAAPDAMVLSAVRNAQCADYRHRSGEFSVPLDFFRVGGIDVTSREHHEIGREFIAWYHGETDPRFMEWFADNFLCAGPVSGARYAESLESLLEWLPARTRLILINVTDAHALVARAPAGIPPALVESWKDHHEAINRAIRELNARHPARTAVIDVNRYVRTDADCRIDAEDDGTLPFGRSYWSFEPYYHFRRHVYVGMALELIDTLMQWSLLPIDPERRQALGDMLSVDWWRQ